MQMNLLLTLNMGILAFSTTFFLMNNENFSIMSMLFITNLILFLTSWNHFIMSLLILELMMIATIPLNTLLISLSNFNYSFFFSFVLISVCEACLGLSVMISFTRFNGNESMKPM